MQETTVTHEYPTGDDLIAAYKLTGAIPDYYAYWKQNGHLHACAVGVLLGADVKERGKNPNRSMGQIRNHHTSLAKVIGMGGGWRAEHLMSMYERGVSTANADAGRASCRYFRPLFGSEDAQAYDAGYRAWLAVLDAVARGELPKLP